MRITVFAVGRTRDGALAAAVAEYEKRAARYWALDVREVRAERGADAASVKAREGARLMQALGATRYVACDERGRSMTSREFAGWMSHARDSARDVAFVIGGAFGLDDSVTSRAVFTLALAPWTLPHEMARLVLVEQIYRAGSLLRGEPYHK